MWQAQVSAHFGGRMRKDVPSLDGKWKEAEKIRLLNMVRPGSVSLAEPRFIRWLWSKNLAASGAHFPYPAAGLPSLDLCADCSVPINTLYRQRSTAVGPRGRAGRACPIEPVPAWAASHRAQRGAAGGVWQGLSMWWWSSSKTELLGSPWSARSSWQVFGRTGNVTPSGVLGARDWQQREHEMLAELGSAAVQFFVRRRRLQRTVTQAGSIADATCTACLPC